MADNDDVLPSALNVLDKLKSEGTFDRFRKTCLAAIEEEPSFRAQKEHVEVLSRRFLQTFDVKEGKTKNEMRSKLRNFVTDEIRKPDVQVSQPIDKLIQKTLESKCPELFQQILDIIDKMQTPSTSLPPDQPLTDNKTNLPPPEPLLYDSNRVPEHSNTSGPPATSSTMEMPIDLLELSTFANPLKRDIKKSIKGKSKSETNKEKNQKGSKQESTERNNVKQSDISNKITADSSATEDIETNNTSKTIVTTEGDKITSSTYTNTSSTVGIEDEDDECCDTLSDSNESGSIPLSSASVIDEGEGPTNTTIQDGVPTVVRRSARLASIEEERKETARQLQEQGSTSSPDVTHDNREDGSNELDNEEISDEDGTNDDDTLIEEMVYDMHHKTRASSRPSRKRRPLPVVSSDSGSEGNEDEQVVEVVRGRGNTKRRRIGHVATGQRSRVNESLDEVKGINNEKKSLSGRETRKRKN